MFFRNRLVRIAVLNIGAAVLVMGLKYAAYRLTGSVALYSDALESIVNVATAIAAVVAIQIGTRPADRHHQFGHHKAEYLAAVLEGAFIIIAALMILKEATGAVLAPRDVQQPFLGIAINAFAAVVNATWAWFLIRRGRQWRSPALIADGWHLMSDVTTSAGVLAGLGLAAATGIRLLDPLLAGLVGLHILWIGYELIRGSASSLMDEAVAPATLVDIRRIIKDNAVDALQFHDIRTRVSGPATFIEFHVVVPGAMTVEASHRICDRIEQALTDTIDGAQVLIHVEPEHKAKATAGGVVDV